MRAARAALLLAGGLHLACGGPDELLLASYSSPREVLHQVLVPAFLAGGLVPRGIPRRVSESFQASGAQLRAILGGLPADVVVLARRSEVERLVAAELVDPAWADGPDRGIWARTQVVIAVRPGNPLGIHRLADLGRPGLALLLPDPATSGGARWSVAALWAAGLGPGGDETHAEALLQAVARNVRVLDKGARDSLLTFEQGIGDAALTYENEVVAARRAGSRIEAVLPPERLWVELPLAVVRANAGPRGLLGAARALRDFLVGPEGQAALPPFGLHPAGAHASGTTVEALGGWPVLDARLFSDDGAWSRALRAAVAGRSARSLGER